MIFYNEQIEWRQWTAKLCHPYNSLCSTAIIRCAVYCLKLNAIPTTPWQHITLFAIYEFNDYDRRRHISFFLRHTRQKYGNNGFLFQVKPLLLKFFASISFNICDFWFIDFYYRLRKYSLVSKPIKVTMQLWCERIKEKFFWFVQFECPLSMWYGMLYYGKTCNCNVF